MKTFKRGYVFINDLASAADARASWLRGLTTTTKIRRIKD